MKLHLSNERKQVISQRTDSPGSASRNIVGCRRGNWPTTDGGPLCGSMFMPLDVPGSAVGTGLAFDCYAVRNSNQPDALDVWCQQLISPCWQQGDAAVA